MITNVVNGNVTVLFSQRSRRIGTGGSNSGGKAFPNEAFACGLQEAKPSRIVYQTRTSRSTKTPFGKVCQSLRVTTGTVWLTGETVVFPAKVVSRYLGETAFEA